MNKKKIIGLSIVGISAASATVGYSVYEKMSNQKYFTSDGYILEAKAEDKNVDEVQYFSEGEKYKENWSNKIEFKNTEGKKVSVDSDNFIHYTNKDVSVMNKGVLIDTNKLNGEKTTSYATPKYAIVKKTNQGHEINNLDEQIPINDYIWKVSNDKYLLVSDNLKLNLGQGKEENVSDYVELEYVEGGIVRLSNDSYNYQTIASEAKVKMANGAELNLDSKDILVNNEVKTNLTNMVIDSNDNIEIVQNNVNKPNKNENSENNKEEGSENSNSKGENGSSGQGGEGSNSTSNNNTNNNNSSGTTENGILGNLLNGALGNNDNNSNGGNGNSGADEEIIAKFIDPTFEFTKFETNPIGFDSTLQIVDKDSVLTGGVTIQVFEKSSNKLVYTQEESEGVLEIDVNMGNLKTNTDYVIKVSSAYQFNGEEYNKVFIEKQFRTESMGIKYESSQRTDKSITVSLSQNSGSKVNGAEVVIYNSKDEKLSSQKITFNENNKNSEFTFDNLDVDTDYTIKLENVLYDGTVVVKDYDEGINVRTLKSAPTIGKPVVKINKRDLKFKLSLDKIDDKYKGVRELRYEVYAVNDLEKPVYSISKSNSSEVEVAVDNVNLFKGTNYTFRVLVDYYDNEKTLQYSSEYAEPFSMEGAQLAQIKEFRAEEVRFDRIKGKLVISDPENTIPTTAKVNYSMSGHSGLGDAYSGETGVVRDGDDIIVDIDKNGLRAGQSYDLSVMVEMDLNDGSGLVKVPLGSIVVRTNNTKPMRIEFDENQYSADSAFNFDMKLVNDDAEYEASTISGMKINLYRGTEEDKELKGTVTISDSNPKEYESKIKEDFYDKKYRVLESLFQNVNDDFDGESYIIEVAEIYDYTDFPNTIPIDGKNSIQVRPNAKPPENEDLINGLEVQTRTKIQESESDDNIKDDTIVKVKLNSNFKEGSQVVRVKYNVFAEKENGTKELLGSIENSKNNRNLDAAVDLDVIAGTSGDLNDDIDSMKSSFEANIPELIRGHKYYFNYEVGFDLDYNGEEDYIATAVANSTTASSTQITGWQDKEAIINKQALSLNIYPESVKYGETGNGANNYNWKFKVSYKDLDNVLKGNKLKVVYGSQNTEKEFSIDKNNIVGNVGNKKSIPVTTDVNELGTGQYRINGEIQYNKAGTNNIQNNTFSEFYFEGLTDRKPNGDSYITTENNVNVNTRFTHTLEPVGSSAFKIRFNDENNAANKIVSADVILKEENGNNPTQSKTYKLNENGEIIIPFSDIDASNLNNFRGKKIKADVKVKYDTGEIDYSGNTKANGLLQVSNSTGVGQYIRVTANSNGFAIDRVNTASGSELTNISFDNNNLMFNEKPSIQHPYEFVGGVMSVSNLERNNSKTPILVKSIKDDFISIKEGQGSQNITIPDVIVPSISISGGNTSINSITFSYNIDQANTDKMKDYTIELYDSETNEKIGEKKETLIRNNTPNISGNITFGGDSDTNMLDDSSNTTGKNSVKHKLKFSSTYYVKVKANMNVNSNGNNVELIDKSTGIAVNKNFTTLGRIDITDFKNSVVSTKGENKKKAISITHDMSPISILSKVKYELTEKESSKKKTIEKTGNEIKTDMMVDFDIEKDFTLGKDYSLKVTPYTTSDSKDVELPSQTYDFKTYNLRLPYTSFNYTTARAEGNSTTKATADLNVKIKDLDGAMEDIKQYDLKIVDNNGKEVKYSDPTVIPGSNEITLNVKLNDLLQDTKYRVTISGKCDTNLDGKAEEEFSKTYEFKTVNSGGVSMGDVSLMQLGNNQIGVSFKNSIGLVSNEANKGAKFVKYTIYDKDGTPLHTYNGNFIPTTYNNGELYVLPLDYRLERQGTYNVEFNLYDYKQDLIDSYNGQYMYGYTSRGLFNTIRNFFKK